MIAAEATLQSAVSALRDFVEYVIALLLLLVEKWNRMIPAQQEFPNNNIRDQPTTAQVPNMKQRHPTIGITDRNIPSTEVTERSIKRRPPRATGEAGLPRTMSTRKAVHLDIGVHAHRRCTSSSGVTTTTSVSALQHSAAKMQPPMIPRLHTNLSEREALAVALRCAVIRKEVKSIKALLEDKRDWVAHILTHWSDSFHSSIIHSAVATADAAVVSELLSHVAESDVKSVVNCQGPQNQTALHIACTKQSLNVCQMLLEKGADPNSCTRQDTRPLHLATGVGDYELCKVLLEHGAETNCISKVGCLPLLTAVELRNEPIVKLLLRFGADPRLSPETGVNARVLAVRMNEKKILETIDESFREARKLLQPYS